MRVGSLVARGVGTRRASAVAVAVALAVGLASAGVCGCTTAKGPVPANHSTAPTATTAAGGATTAPRGSGAAGAAASTAGSNVPVSAATEEENLRLIARMLAKAFQHSGIRSLEFT